MRCTLLLLALSATVAFGQTSLTAVVATINGKPYTAADIEQIINSFPKAQRANFQREPKRFLEEWAQMQAILAEAEKDKVAEQSPYKEQLEDIDRQHQLARKQVLFNAELTQRANKVPVTTASLQQRYQRDIQKYREAKIKLIYIPYTPGPVSAADKARGVLDEAAARSKAEALAKQARGGADFIKLVKEHSEDPGSAAKDGDFATPVRSNTDKLPPDARSAILAAKAGDVLDPVKHNNGFYVYRVESVTATPFEQVRDEIFKEIQNAAILEWLTGIRSQVTVNIENEAYFKR